MAGYCDIEDKFLGKKLDIMFYEKNRNMLAALIGDDEFKKWFGNGKLDFEGNPLIDGSLAFTNEQGQKKAIFDFGNIGFHDKGDVMKFLKAFDALYKYKGDMLVNNTLKSRSGQFAAQTFVQAMRVINYYYPNLLGIEQYERSKTSPFTKGDIPLYVVKVADNIPYVKSTLFSYFDTIQQPPFKQIADAEALLSMQQDIDEYKTFHYTTEDLGEIATPSKVSKDTYKRLEEFFLKLNPSAKIEEVKGLSHNGIAYIRDFFIQLDSEAKYGAMPEEVAHFFVAMLPSDHPLKKDMMSNITSFGIYATTLSQYKSDPAYQNDKGGVNYEKVKTEAVGKLIAEYIHAISENDFEKSETLTRTKDGFLRRWWKRFVNWIKGALNIEKKERFESYLKSARDILHNEADYLSQAELAKLNKDDVYFQYSDRNQTQMAMAKTIIEDVSKVGKLGELNDVIDKFRREMGKALNTILQTKGYEALNKALSSEMVDPNDPNSLRLNELGILHNIVKEVKLGPMMEADNQVLNLQKFIGVVQNMEEIAKIYNTLVDTYTADGDQMNIAELELFKSTYRNIESIMTNDLAKVLADSEVQYEIISSLQKATSGFDTVEKKIISKLRDSFTVLLKNTLAPQNDVIINELANQMKINILYQNEGKKDAVTKAIDSYKKSLKDGLSKLASKKQLIQDLKEAGIPTRRLASPVLSEAMDKVDKLYTTDQAVKDFMNGLGNDIDLTSNMTHYVTAAIKNHDILTANVANFIVQRRSAAQNLARVATMGYLKDVDPYLKTLASVGMNEYKAGDAITFVDEVYDASTDPKTGVLNHENKQRKVISFLNPTINQANVDKRGLEVKRDEARAALEGAIKGSDGYDDLKKNYADARKAYIDFNDKYFNSPYTREYRDFLNKWNTDEDFLDIKEQWDNASREMREALDRFNQDKRDDNAWVDFFASKRKRAAIRSTKDRTDEEIAQVEKLNNYFEEAGKYREDDKFRTRRNYLLGRKEYENKLDYAIGVFLNNAGTSGNYDLDTLETTLRTEMKDPSIRIKSAYKFETADMKGISQNHVRSDVEVDKVKQILLNKFDGNSIVKVRTQAYYDEVDLLYKKIEELKAKKELSPTDIAVSDLYKQIADLLQGKDDYYGQRNSETLSDDELKKVMDMEDRLQTIKDYGVRQYEVTKAMRDEDASKGGNWKRVFDFYDESKKKLADILAKPILTDKDEQEATDIRNDIADSNNLMEKNRIIPKEQIDVSEQIKGLYQALAELNDKRPTQAYWEKMEDLIDLVDDIMREKQVYRDNNGSTLPLNDQKSLNKEIETLSKLLNGSDGNGGLYSAVFEGNYELLDLILNDEYVPDGLLPIGIMKYFTDISSDSQKGQEFMEWFYLNHKEGTVFTKDVDNSTGLPVSTTNRRDRPYVRRLFATYSDPVVEESMGKTLYEEKIASRFRASKLKEDAYAKQTTWKDSDDMQDWTVDNKSLRPEYLPMSKKQLATEGKTDTRYTNPAYHGVFDNSDTKNKALQGYLTTSMKTYLGEQEDKPDNIKSMFRLPVTAKDRFQKDMDIPDQVKRGAQNLKGIFTKSPVTDTEDQLTGVDQIRDVDEYTQDLVDSKIPKLGMNVKLDHERVNRNVAHVVNQYIINSKDFEARSDLNPLIKGLLSVMQANETVGNMNQRKRLKMFQSIYDQMILEEMPDNITNSRQFRKLARTLMSFGAYRLTADMAGGAINLIQAKMNNITEAVASQHTTPSSYAVGSKLAFQMTGQIAMDYNKRTDLHFWTLMYQAFDFVQGEWAEDIDERSALTAKKFSWRKWLMYPRKNGELYAQSAMAISILDNHRVENTIDGKKYPMWNIYKKEGNDLVLKPGFDHDLYNPVNGSYFLKIRSKVHAVNIDLHGNYAKINQTEASRHSVGKLMETMKRWFVPAIQRRMGRESFDVSKDNLDEGYYRTAAKMGVSVIKQLLKFNLDYAKEYVHSNFATPRKAQNLKRMAFDFMACAGLLLLTMAMGYNNNDPDKNKKLRDNSWAYNEALLIFLRSYAEQTSFIPIPPFGFTEMSRNLLDPFSVAKSTFGNAAGSLALLLYTVGYGLGIDSLQNDAYYQKDTGAGKGPTLFGINPPGQKGDLKLWNYVAKLFGYSGAQIDPAYYIKNFQSLQGKIK